MSDINKYVQQFVTIRDKLREMEEQYEKQCAPLREVKELLSGKIQAFLDAHHLTNVKTEAGTAYISTKRTASLADPEAFMNFIIRSERWELLDRRANSTAVQDYVSSEGALPPGCNLNARTTIGVQRGSK